MGDKTANRNVTNTLKILITVVWFSTHSCRWSCPYSVGRIHSFAAVWTGPAMTHVDSLPQLVLICLLKCRLCESSHMVQLFSKAKGFSVLWDRAWTLPKSTPAPSTPQRCVTRASRKNAAQTWLSQCPFSLPPWSDRALIFDWTCGFSV